ncbi:MAG: AAA family ATPase, partial [Desulfovibrionaceae bacterium]|nr:AAA family ATPase [Desulfovibrionaceae bacterium]
MPSSAAARAAGPSVLSGPPVPSVTADRPFARMRAGGRPYIDKTAFIAALLAEGPCDVTVVTRPAGFGKTLMLDMLRTFFDIGEPHGRELFRGLAVLRKRALCRVWMRSRPVVCLSLHGMPGENFAEWYKAFRDLAAALCAEHAALLASPRVGMAEKRRLKAITGRQAGEETVSLTLGTLCMALLQEHGRPAILLVDDFDAPLAGASADRESVRQNGTARFLRGLFRAALRPACPAASPPEFALFFGRRPCPEHRLFPDGSFACCDAADPRFAAGFGFTEAEVDALLAAAGFAGSSPAGWKEALRDGCGVWRFGCPPGQAMFSPREVQNFIGEPCGRPDAARSPAGPWSVPGPSRERADGIRLVRTVLERTPGSLAGLAGLVSGGSIGLRVCRSMARGSFSDASTFRGQHPWAALCHAGLLAGQPAGERDGGGDDRKPDSGEDSELAAVLSGRQARDLVLEGVRSWLADILPVDARGDLFGPLRDCDSARFAAALEGILSSPAFPALPSAASVLSMLRLLFLARG